MNLKRSCEIDSILLTRKKRNFPQKLPSFLIAKLVEQLALLTITTTLASKQQFMDVLIPSYCSINNFPCRMRR